MMPIPVATVYNWGDFNGQDESYPRLGIEHGWNCLWLENAGHDRWRAAITNDVARPCAYHHAPSNFPLDVLRLRPAREHAFARRVFEAPRRCTPPIWSPWRTARWTEPA